ncbi:MAG: PHP domain-containing protein [Acidobacteriota bacterium]|nr:PHP domain-containing protein [Acidobacteriota bacterium]
MDNLAVARLLSETADLMEISQDNPFKIRAYRNAAQVVAALPSPVAGMSLGERLALPGIGKDLSAKLDEILRSGTTAMLTGLRASTPASLLDIKQLPGIGPRTMLMLWKDLGIASPADLEAAIRAGRLRAVRGFGPKKEAALLKALAQRTSATPRHLLPDCRERAAALSAWLSDRVPRAQISIAGGIRRGVELCTGVDIVAAGTPSDQRALQEAFRSYSLVETAQLLTPDVMAARLWGGMEARLYLSPPARFGLTLLWQTGSDAHIDGLQARAGSAGLTLSASALARGSKALDVPSEEAVYEALGLAWTPPELREGAGEIESAARGALPALLQLSDLRGDLHMHTTASDGKVDAEAMAAAARDAGLDYIVITDHSNALPMVNGLDNVRALEHAAAIRALDARMRGIRVLAGIECDILADGRMDLDDEVLQSLDFVAASLHSALTQPRDVATARVLRAIANPWVDMLAHPTGRKLLRRDGADLDMDAVIGAAAREGVAMEINSQVDRLDLKPEFARQARDRGILIAVDSDAHSPRGLLLKQWGIVMARRAGLRAEDCLNARPFKTFRAALRRSRYTAAQR